tara:strand:+ start:1505 stop:2461 length:957 start_codon:yes stop_codon:yes gene_type:complete
MVQNKILVIGHQKASIELFYKSLKHILNNNFYKIFYWNDNFIQKKFTDKLIYTFELKHKNDLKNLHNKSMIITGTSGVYLEKNIWTYCHQYNLNYAAYVDSTVNIRVRFSNSNIFPKLILVPDESVTKKIKCFFPNKIKNTKIINIGFISHYYLKHKLKKTNKSRKSILYVTSDISIFYETKLIAKINEYAFENKKKLYVCIHPRENLKKWKHSLKKLISSDNINQGKLLQTSKEAHEIFGVSTMALLDMHIFGKDVFFLDGNQKNSKLRPLFKKYGINSFRFYQNNLIKIKNKKYIVTPNRNEVIKIFKNILNGSKK